MKYEYDDVRKRQNLTRVEHESNETILIHFNSVDVLSMQKSTDNYISKYSVSVGDREFWCNVGCIDLFDIKYVTKQNSL